MTFCCSYQFLVTFISYFPRNSPRTWVAIRLSLIIQPRFANCSHPLTMLMDDSPQNGKLYIGAIYVTNLSKICPKKLINIPKKRHEIKKWFIHSFQKYLKLIEKPILKTLVKIYKGTFDVNIFTGYSEKKNQFYAQAWCKKYLKELRM